MRTPTRMRMPTHEHPPSSHPPLAFTELFEQRHNRYKLHDVEEDWKTRKELVQMGIDRLMKVAKE